MNIFDQNTIKKTLAVLMPIIFLGALNFCLLHPNIASAEIDPAPAVSNIDQEMAECQHNLAVDSKDQQSPKEDSDAGAPIQNSSSFCCVVHDSDKTETSSQNQEFGNSAQTLEAGNFSFDSLIISNDSLNLYLLALSPPEPELLASILKKE